MQSRSSSPSRTISWLRSALGRVEMRLFLSLCIIVSLLPYPWVHGFDLLFLTIFTLEFSVRAILTFRVGADEVVESMDAAGRMPSWRRPSLLALVLLTLDLLALVSFLPLDVRGPSTARWFRLFRLSRILLILGYWGPLVGDLWTVIVRRERARQLALMGLVVVGLSFAGAVVIEHGLSNEAVDFDADGQFSAEDHQFPVRLWWAFRQIQDPGNYACGAA